MARIKSKKYNGVYLNHLLNGDITYSVTYKDESNKKIFYKIGKKSEGITEVYSYNKRNEFINKVRLGEDPLASKKQKSIIAVDSIAKIYFDDKRCMQCESCKAFMQLSDDIQKTNNTLICSNRKVKHQYNKYIKYLRPKFGKLNISSVKKDDILKLKQALLSQKKAENTINGIIQLFSAIINYSIKQKDFKIVNPCIGISKLSSDNVRERYLTTSEVNILLNYLTDDRALLFIRLSLSTGGRLQTILNIKKKDINLTLNTITLKDIKNNDTYNGFIDDGLKYMLKIYTEELKADDYIIGRKSAPLSVNAISVSIRPKLNELFNKELAAEDRKNRVVIHTLRHTFASHLAINGTPIFTIQKLLNHKDIKMTMRYAKLAPDSGRDMVKNLYQ